MIRDRELYEEARRLRRDEDLTLDEIVTRLRAARTTVSYAIRGLPLRRKRKSKPPTAWQKKDKRPALSKADIGEAARQMICARLMLAGLMVFRPLSEDTPIDLLVLRDGAVLKCQCKFIYERSNGSHKLNLYAIRKWGPNKKAVRHVYTKDEVDFFLGYCVLDDAIYVVPFEEAGGRSSLHLWIGRACTGRNQHRQVDCSRWKNAFDRLRPRSLADQASVS